MNFWPRSGILGSMAEKKPSEKTPEEPPESINLRADVPAEIRNVSFPVSVRGYDRGAVDAYVKRVNRVIAELEVSRSPQAAVRHAVERVSEQTKGILQEARESAEKITATAHEEAGRIAAAAKAEAAELVVNTSSEADRRGAEAEQAVAAARAQAEGIREHAQSEAAENLRRADEEIASRVQEAEARIRELQTDTDAVWAQRQELLGEIDAMATRLHEAATEAAARLSRQGSSEETEQAPAHQDAPETAPTLVGAPRQQATRRGQDSKKSSR
jgi:DivIVA domain-containing protein